MHSNSLAERRLRRATRGDVLHADAHVFYSGDGQLQLAAVGTDSCRSCGACSQSVIEPPADARIVRLQLPSATLMQIAALIYAVPLAGLLAALGLAAWLGLSDLPAALAALSGAGAASIICHPWVRRLERSLGPHLPA